MVDVLRKMLCRSWAVCTTTSSGTPSMTRWTHCPDGLASELGWIALLPLAFTGIPKSRQVISFPSLDASQFAKVLLFYLPDCTGWSAQEKFCQSFSFNLPYNDDYTLGLPVPMTAFYSKTFFLHDERLHGTKYHVTSASASARYDVLHWLVPRRRPLLFLSNDLDNEDNAADFTPKEIKLIRNVLQERLSLSLDNLDVYSDSDSWFLLFWFESGNQQHQPRSRWNHLCFGARCIWHTK